MDLIRGQIHQCDLPPDSWTRIWGADQLQEINAALRRSSIDKDSLLELHLFQDVGKCAPSGGEKKLLSQQKGNILRQNKSRSN